MECYSAIKKKKIMPFPATWIDLGIVIVSEGRQIEEKYRMTSLIRKRKCWSVSRIWHFMTLDCSPPGSSVHETSQATILEWTATPSSRYLPNSGIESRSPALQADCLLSEPPEKHNIPYRWNIKWYKWTYLQNRKKKLTALKNKLWLWGGGMGRMRGRDSEGV